MGFRGRTKAERQVAIDGVRFRYHGAAYILYAIKRKYFYISIRVAPRICLFVPSIERYSGFFYFFAKEKRLCLYCQGDGVI
ncbi:MAG TPA: hypothetical protein DD628_06480 [Clostridiales bacterium]|nr:hypothetical protein [Candidatus Apopatosoma intestinale]